jgi:glycosyltransferase involved in cell wall biosynthesis
LPVKNRVLEIVATLKPAGAEHVVVSLASGLDPARFEVAVVSLYDAFVGGLETLLHGRGIRVWHLGKRAGPDPRMYSRLQNVLYEFRPDVIHSHCYVTRYTVHLQARAMVHTVHNLASAEVGFLGRIFNRYAFRHGVASVAVGGAVADSFLRMYGFPPSATIPNGIDTARFWRPEARYRWRCENGFNDDDLLVVSVGRLVPQKNPLALVKAVSAIPGMQLLIVGDGSLRARLQGHNRVHLLGLRSDIPEILAAGDIFALASDWEGLPLAVMEAMAAGLPVVATAVGSVPEVVEHGKTGLLVPPGDKSALILALRELAGNHKRRREMGQAARTRSAAFGVEAMVAAYDQLFGRLLEGDARERSHVTALHATLRDTD